MPVKKKTRKARKPKFQNITVSSKAIFTLATKEIPMHFRRKMALMIYGDLPERSKLFFLKAALPKIKKASRDRLIKRFCPKK